MSDPGGGGRRSGEANATLNHDRQYLVLASVLQRMSLDEISVDRDSWCDQSVFHVIQHACDAFLATAASEAPKAERSTLDQCI